MANGTWELTPIPKNRQSVGCKWVFRTKRDASGNVVKYKARLVAKGYSQVASVDLNKTFALVAKFSTIRCILALGTIMDLCSLKGGLCATWAHGGHHGCESSFLCYPHKSLQAWSPCQWPPPLHCHPNTLFGVKWTYKSQM